MKRQSKLPTDSQVIPNHDQGRELTFGNQPEIPKKGECLPMSVAERILKDINDYNVLMPKVITKNLNKARRARSKGLDSSRTHSICDSSRSALSQRKQALH